MQKKILVLLAVLLLALSLAACGNTETATDSGDDAVEVVATEAAEEATDVGEAVEEAVEETGEAAEEVIEEPAEEMAEMGEWGTEENPIVMSFVPSGDTQEIVASGEEIAQMITEKTGLVVEPNVATSYAAVVEALGAGNADIGWLNTFGYVLASEKYNVDVSLATVRRGTPYYTGQIVANVDAGIASLEDVEGKTACWVDPISTSGYIIPRIMVAAAGVDVDALESQFSGSHPNVITAVYNGDCDFGASFVDARTTIAEEFPDVNDRVIIITESPRIPNDTVAFAEEVPADIRGQIVDALLEISQTEEGAAALEAVYEIEGFEPVEDSFYDDFRTQLDASGINIEELTAE